ncbi:MAG: hypothetical protein K1X51_18610 [Rhodospirillaceae bacterium]|nr:hypothetical protein [Rhodospirillaceae bacterium]
MGDSPETVGEAAGETAAQWLERGEAHMTHGEAAAACAAFAHAHAAAPGDPRTSFVYAQALAVAGRLVEALKVIAAALVIHPDDISLLRLAIELHQAAGDLRSALETAGRLEAAAPRDPAVRVRSGRLWMTVADSKAAVAAFEAALALDPACRPAMDGLADVWRLDGETDKARDILMRRAAIPDDPQIQAAARFKAATIQPVVARDRAEIDRARAEFAAVLARGPEAPCTDPWALGLGPNFYLAYQGRDDRALQEAQAAYFRAATPSLSFTARHIGRKPAGRIRVGIVSHFFTKHTVGYLTLGLATLFDRARFDLVLFRTPNAARDGITPQFGPIVDLPPNLAQAREAIAAAELDVLHYPEIGMDHFTYFLAFARLATVQSMAWGHPVTSGLPTIDLFLSVDDMEPENAAAHYRERLVRLKGLSFAGARPVPPDIADGLLDKTRPAYVCAQSMFKAHPDFDPVLARILREDPQGVLYFIGHSPAATAVFRTRLERLCGEAVARVRFLPHMNGRQFLALVRAADVLLDIPQWSGGKTSLEALAMGTPIVHRSGAFMRGRHTRAFYKRMGIDAMIADSDEAYAALALRAVRDKTFRKDVRDQIAAHSASLFDDAHAIREIEEVWRGALGA